MLYILKLIKNPILTPYTAAVLCCDQTLNIEKAKKELGYEPKYTILEGFRRYEKHRNI